MAHVNRKEYWVIFGLLALLTVIEIIVPYLEGSIGRGSVIGLLIALAIGKAGLVGLFYMHLKHETRGLQYTVFIPLAVPGIYALVLILEGAWRLLPEG